MAGDLMTSGPLLGAHAAIEARLKTFFPASHFAHGQVPARLTREGWQRLLHRTPFIGIGWRGFAADGVSGRILKGRAQWTVFLATRSVNSPEARLMGSPQGPGLYGLVQVASACLQGFTIAPDTDGAVGTVTVAEVANLTVDGWDDEACAIAGLNIEIYTSMADWMSAAQLDDFLRAGVTWQFDPGTATVASDTYATRSS